MNGEQPQTLPTWQDPAISVQHLAEALDLPPEVVTEWRAGLSRPTYVQRKEIERFVTMDRWGSAIRALDLPECPEMSRLVEILDGGRISFDKGLTSLERHEKGCTLCQSNRQKELTAVGPYPAFNDSFAESLLLSDGVVGAACRLVHRPRALPLTIGATGLSIWALVTVPEVAKLTIIAVFLCAALAALSIRSLWRGAAD